MLVHTVNIQDLATKFFLEYRNSEQSLDSDSECKNFQAAQASPVNSSEIVARDVRVQ